MEQDGFVKDPTQAAAVECLQQVYQALLHPVAKPLYRKGGLFSRIRRNNSDPIKGIYLWGGVGRGKTWLMDLFFNALPFKEKRRLHFHRFMRQVHQGLAHREGQVDPLQGLADTMADDIRVLCLDEFMVTDIGDAMIMAQLLKALFERGVTLITTSNSPPDNLYEHGLQRSSFLPAIGLLKAHSREVELASNNDYRLRFLARATVYHTELGARTDAKMLAEFLHLAPEKSTEGGSIQLVGREIPIKRLADDVVWFDFIALCGPPRSQADYIEVARCFHTVFISDIPTMGPGYDDIVRRFIFLIDEFYDRHVKLIVAAEKPPEILYVGERLAFEFKRTASRLHEMQSPEWLAKEHRP